MLRFKFRFAACPGMNRYSEDPRRVGKNSVNDTPRTNVVYEDASTSGGDVKQEKGGGYA